MTLAVLLLAAGHGTRMNSKVQKVLHDVGGKPMIMHIFVAAEAVADVKPVVVVGAGEHGVRRLLGKRAEYVVQKERLGTGHATLMARDALAGRADQVLVTYGDMPLLQTETMTRLADTQAESGAAVVMLSTMGEPDSTFGRVVRDGQGHVAEIVEVAEAKLRDDPEALLAIRELNAGVYCFDGPWLWENLPHIPLREARSGPEYYLTDMIGAAVAQGRLVEAVVAGDPDECLGAGTRAELVEVERAFRERANRRWLEAGVTLLDPATTYIDQEVIIGQDTTVWPNTYLQGETTVGENCMLGPNTILRDARLGAGCRVVQAVVEDAELKAGSVLEPFTYLKRRNLASGADGEPTDRQSSITSEKMPTQEQKRTLREAACASRENAYAPYSNYRVGAAVLGASGAIYTGANIENASYSPTVCAERLAIFKAIEAGEPQIKGVAVCTENGASPCGPCRQVMREFAEGAMPVLMLDAAGNSRTKTLAQLLPDSFGPEHL